MSASLSWQLSLCSTLIVCLFLGINLISTSLLWRPLLCSICVVCLCLGIILIDYLAQASEQEMSGYKKLADEEIPALRIVADSKTKDAENARSRSETLLKQKEDEIEALRVLLKQKQEETEVLQQQNKSLDASRKNLVGQIRVVAEGLLSKSLELLYWSLFLLV